MASKNQTVTQNDKQTTTSKSQSQQSQQSQSTTQAVVNSELLAQILAGLQDAGYTQKTTDELMKIAEDYYLPQYNAQIEAEQQEQAVKDMSYTQQLENLQSAYGKNIDVQNAAFDKSRAALETGALSRGMGRSSYTMATLSGNDQARSAALAQLADDYLQNVRQVTDEQALSAAQSAETIGRLKADKATNITNTLRELADTEYQKYITGVNQQNANYLAAVQAAMGQMTTGQTTGTSTTNETSNTTGQSTQVTVAGGSGTTKLKNNNDQNKNKDISPYYDANMYANHGNTGGGSMSFLNPKDKQKQQFY